MILRTDLSLAAALAAVAAFLTSTAAAVVVDFSEVTLDPESHFGGAGTGATDFVIDGITFPHETSDFSWSGFTYSNITDNTTAGFGNQFSAIPGSGNGDANYGIGFIPLDFLGGTFEPISQRIDLGGSVAPESIAITNATFPYFSMLEGDSFAKKFGGADGTDPDFFKLIISGIDSEGQETGSIDFYLADFRFADDSLDFIVDEWTLVDLTPLGNSVAALQFSMASSDTGAFGINTPGFYAFDDLTVVPEPSTLGLFALGALGFLAVMLRRRGS